MKVSDIITRARDILQDRDKIRWADYELTWWINDAYSELATKRPDAFVKPIRIEVAATQGMISCAETTALADAVRIVDVLLTYRVGRNQWDDARSCRLIDRSILDDQVPAWFTMGRDTHPKYWVFESGSPTVIQMYPAPTAKQYVELAVALAPSTHRSPQGYNDVIRTTSFTWAPIILDYVLYRAYSKDAEYAANAEKAALFYNRVQDALKLKTPGEIAVFSAGIRPTRKARMINPNQPT